MRASVPSGIVASQPPARSYPRVSDKPGPERSDTLISARPLAEYRAMFDLSDADLAGHILDCPGGGSSFAAEVREAGGRVTSVDPAYDRAADDLGPHVVDEVDRGNQYVRDNLGIYDWSWFSDPECHRRMRLAGARRFAADYAAHPGRYLTGSLPALPFEDRRFDLTLSSHLLFTYGDRLDLGFHLGAARELVRVTHGEVRLYPLVTIRSRPYGRMDELRSRLAAEGIESEVRTVPYVFQLGADRALALRRSSP